MKTKIAFWLFFALVMNFACLAGLNASTSANAVAINKECSTESAVANCGEKKVGSGLVPCMHEYSKDHKDFKISTGCDKAISQYRRDHMKMSTTKNALSVNRACSTDASTASCGSEQVGTGLMDCLRGYKQQHEDYKFTRGCSASLKKFYHDKHAKWFE